MVSEMSWQMTETIHAFAGAVLLSERDKYFLFASDLMPGFVMAAGSNNSNHVTVVTLPELCSFVLS